VGVTLTVDLADRVVLVTGGGKGVGRGISTTFLAAGAHVVITSRTEPEALPSVGDATATYIAADVRDAEAVHNVIDNVMEQHGRIDVVINNAGGSPHVDAADSSPRFVEKIIALNLLAPFYVAQAANVVMQKQDAGGVIINVGSVSGGRPSPGTAAYGAAKAGLASMTRTLAVEWAPRVRVNLVVAGMVRTEQSELHYGDDESLAAVAATVPLGRLAEPDDVGQACAWLASPLAAYVTGAELTLHGGGEWPAFLRAAGKGDTGE
jgi:NAD(P)-dependent dehydrogenase (short-subunit alcohol dehydrogenase family)